MLAWARKIESRYETPLDSVKLTEEERSALSPRVRAYIEHLEQEVYSWRRYP